MAMRASGHCATGDRTEVTLVVIDLRNLRQLRLRMQAVVLKDGSLGFIELDRDLRSAPRVERAVAVLVRGDPAIIEAEVSRPPRMKTRR